MRNEKRMPKGWTHVSTNVNATTSETKGKDRKAQNLIRNTRSKSYEDLKKECNAAYAAEETRKANLLQAYEDKKLKSKSLIKEAQGIKKEQVKAAEKAAKKNKNAAE